MIQLRDYQLEAIEASEHALTAGTRTQLVCLPTGTGKTVVFSSIVRKRGGTALIVAHRDELLEQAEDKLRTVAPELGMSIGRVQASRNEVGAPIVIASVQTLASAKRRAQLPAYFDTVVIDEAHHATAPSYVKTLEHVVSSPLVLGFTATAERHDKKSDLRNVFDDLVFARSLEQMIREGYLCDLRALRVELEALDLSKVKKSRGDYQAADLGKALEAAHAVDHAVAAYLEHAYDKQTVAFFPTVELSRGAAACFKAAGVNAEHIDGTTPRQERRDILKHLAAGAVTLVCNVGVLTEGFDEPSLECIIIAAPTKSRIKYAQMVGRGTRLFPGKTECLILDLAGVTDDLSIQSVGVLFGLRKPPKPGETATQAVDRQRADDAKRLARPTNAPRRRPTRSRPAHLFNRDAIQWCHVGDRYIVGLKGDIHLVLDPTGEHWRVLVMGPNTAKIAARNLDIGYAMGAAETIIRDANVTNLADRDAPWRYTSSTPGQRAYYRRISGQPAPRGLTKGDLADLITTAIASERLARFDRAIATRNTVNA